MLRRNDSKLNPAAKLLRAQREYQRAVERRASLVDLAALSRLIDDLRKEVLADAH